MAFKLIARNSVNVPVKGVLSDDAGQPERFEFTLQCRRLGADALRDKLKNGGERSVKSFMQDVAEGWRGVQGADGQPLPFTDDNLDALLDTPGLAQLAFEAYLQEQAAKAKN